MVCRSPEHINESKGMQRSLIRSRENENPFVYSCEFGSRSVITKSYEKDD